MMEWKSAGMINYSQYIMEKYKIVQITNQL